MLWPMDDIAASLDKLSLLQMVLAWTFLAGYATALGGMLEARGSRRAAGLAVLAAVLFCVLAENWVHGALLVMFAVAGMGLFVAVAWVLSRGANWFITRDTPAKTAPLPRPAKPQPIGVMLRDLWRRSQA